MSSISGDPPAARLAAAFARYLHLFPETRAPAPAPASELSLEAGGDNPATPSLPNCPKNCPCLRPFTRSGPDPGSGKLAGWGREDTAATRKRQREAFTLLLSGTRYPLNLQRCMTNPWLLPHRWAGVADCQSGDVSALKHVHAWNRETAELLLEQTRGAPPPAGGDPILSIYYYGGQQFPQQVYSTGPRTRWRDWLGCLKELLGTGPGLGTLPISALQYPDYLLVSSPDAIQRGDWSCWTKVPNIPQAGGDRDVAPAGELGGQPHEVELPRFRNEITLADDLDISVGELGELLVQQALHGAAVAHCAQARVVRTGHRPRSGDFQVTLAEGLFLVEVKNYTRAVPAKEVDKLRRDLEASGARGGILISLGPVAGVRNPSPLRFSTACEQQVVRQPAAFDLEMVPSLDGQVRPLLTVCSHAAGPGRPAEDAATDLSHLCSLALSATSLLATRHPHVVGRAPSAEVLEALLLRLHQAGTAISAALEAQQSSLQATLSVHHQGIAALATARSNLASLEGQVRAEVGAPPTKSRLSTWAAFQDAVGGMHAPDLVHQVWSALNGGGVAWTIEQKAGTCTASCSWGATHSATFRFLATSSRCVVPTAALQSCLAAWLSDPVLQKSLAVSCGGGREAVSLTDVRLDEPMLAPLLAALGNV